MIKSILLYAVSVWAVVLKNTVNRRRANLSYQPTALNSGTLSLPEKEANPANVIPDFRKAIRKEQEMATTIK